MRPWSRKEGRCIEARGGADGPGGHESYQCRRGRLSVPRPSSAGSVTRWAAGGADDLLTFRRTLGSPTSRGTLVVVGEFGTRFGTGAARPVATEGLSGTSLNGVLCCFVVCCCTPQGREKPTGTGAPSYGSEGWGFESLRARKSAGHRLADQRLIFGPTKFGTQVGTEVGILTRPEARFPYNDRRGCAHVPYARAGLGVAVALAGFAAPETAPRGDAPHLRSGRNGGAWSRSEPGFRSRVIDGMTETPVQAGLRQIGSSGFPDDGGGGDRNR